jgi:hypothetical protein
MFAGELASMLVYTLQRVTCRRKVGSVLLLRTRHMPHGELPGEQRFAWFRVCIVRVRAVLRSCFYSRISRPQLYRYLSAGKDCVVNSF